MTTTAMTTTAEPVFVDTNVLVYLGRSSAPQHGAARNAVRQLQADGRPLWISPQVLREYLSVVTRPQATAPALPLPTAISDVRRFAELFNLAEERPAVLDRLLQILTAHPSAGKQVHDANLVATMLEQGITCLLTFNQRDFRRFGAIVTLEAIPP